MHSCSLHYSSDPLLLSFTYDLGCLVFSSHQDGAAPLGIAADRGHTGTVQRLLEAGATVNYQNKVIVVGLSKPQNRFPLNPHRRRNRGGGGGGGGGGLPPQYSVLRGTNGPGIEFPRTSAHLRNTQKLIRGAQDVVQN